MSRIYYGIQTRLRKDTAGNYFTDANYARYDRWTHFLEVFDEVHILCRVTDSTHSRGHRVDGPGVVIHDLPTFRSWRAFLRDLPRVLRIIWRIKPGPGDVLGGRLFGPITPLLFLRARRLRPIPFLAEVVGDPAESARLGTAGAMGKLVAPLIAVAMRRIVKSADASIFVTRYSLQRTYPPNPRRPSISFSTVELPDSPGRFEPRDFHRNPVNSPLRLLTVGSQEQRYKGHDLLIRATSALIDCGIPTHTTIIGGGRYHNELRDLVAEMGLQESVTLTGHINDREIIDRHYRDADVFILASRTEGLCRALIEAMSFGLPCVVSNVGGNPELASPIALFESDSVPELVGRITRLQADPEMLTNLAHHSTAVSARYGQLKRVESTRHRRELLKTLVQ